MSESKDDLIEKVARAMEDAAEYETDNYGDGDPHRYVNNWHGISVATLAAIESAGFKIIAREPTEGMLLGDGGAQSWQTMWDSAPTFGGKDG